MGHPYQKHGYYIRVIKLLKPYQDSYNQIINRSTIHYIFHHYYMPY